MESIIAIATERIFDSSRIFRELNYKQEYAFETGIARTIEWYLNNVNGRDLENVQ